MLKYPYQLDIDHFIDTVKDQFSDLNFIMQPDHDLINIKQDQNVIGTIYFTNDRVNNIIFTPNVYQIDPTTHDQIVALRNNLIAFNHSFNQLNFILNRKK